MIPVDLLDDVDLFHTPAGEAYASFTMGGHTETWSVRSGRFRLFLRERAWQMSHVTISDRELDQHLEQLASQALFEGAEREVYTRIAGVDGRVFLDLGDDAWRAVEISAAGWRVVDHPPVRFVRSPQAEALPEPVLGGSVDELRRFLNVGSDEDFQLVVGWVLGVYRPEGPYPILILQGEQGTAKSTTARVIRSLVDPSSVPVRSLPGREQDLMINAPELLGSELR